MNKFKTTFFGFLGFLAGQLIVGTIGILFYIFLTKDSIILNIILFIQYVIISALVLTLLDYFRRTKLVDKPLNDIVSATEKMARGDFSVRLKHTNEYTDYDKVDIIKDHLNYMAEELSKSEVLKNDFISNVSHELKTPLAGIKNYVNLLKSKSISDEEKEKYLDNLENLCGRLSNLITNILKLNKLENQSVLPNKESVNVSELLQNKLISIIDIIETKNINLELDIDENIVINTDESNIEIIFNNLISNAIKFTSENGTIDISLKNENGTLIFKVRDTGCGMSKDTGKHIFDKFYQGDTTHSKEGNGLGLPLVKRVVDLMGGFIEVNSVENEGSTFIVGIKEIKDVE